MKRILFLAATFALLVAVTAFPALSATETNSYSRSNASPAFANDESDTQEINSDYFNTKSSEDDESDSMDDEESQDYSQRKDVRQLDQQKSDGTASRRSYDQSRDEQVDSTADNGKDDFSAKDGKETKDLSDSKDGTDSRDLGERKSVKDRKDRKDDKEDKDSSKQRGAKKRKVAKDSKKKKSQKKVVKKRVEPEELSVLEKAMGEMPTTLDKSRPQPYGWDQLTQFGYNFFKHDEDPFASQTDVPVGPDYIVGAGDRMTLTVWGSLNGKYNLEVNRSGDVVVPKVGAVRVAGQPFGQLPTILKGAIGRIYKDFQLNVNVANVRMVKVYVVGEVAAPGDYNVSSLSTVINALSAAGGPTKSGSLRNIQINRGGKVVETVDLYDFFLKGDKSKDIRLQPGDTILVPVLGHVAGVAGNVRRPGIYELKDENSIKDILTLCGGINATGYLQRVQLYRVQAHDKKMVTDFSLDLSGTEGDKQTAAIRLQDMDLVNVLPIDGVLRGYVRLEGHVLRPGDYALKPGMRVSALIKGDNLLPQYHAGAGQITRLFPPDMHPELVYFDVTRALKGDADQDLELKEFDRVKIFARDQMQEIPAVKVSGEVQKPGQFRYLDNMTVRDLLMQAGNVKLSAYLKSAEITRIKRNGDAVTSYSITIDLEKALQGGAEDFKLEPFDELTVRRIPNWAEATERYVTLKGEVRFPGTYPIYKGERLSSVINRAGGFTDLAYLKGARFTREAVRKLQQQRMDEALEKSQEKIINLQAQVSQTAASAEEVASSKTTLDNLMQSIELLKKRKAEGRVVMEIASLEELKGGAYDLELQGGDQLVVPSDPGGVNVIGDVYNQSTVVTQRGHDIEWYLKQVGGPTGDADMDSIYVVKVDGSVISQANSSKFMFYNSFWGKKLDSGDTIIVPRQYEKTAWLRGAKDIASVIGNIAVTAGVLVAAGL
ncbi:SLBB domain-containing protein [Geomonas agri]|uniref:SLBB domain-containing protein n=1 Tax=Geomonas agri TaxID=2873702 RepID=UPI001CD5ED2B|nr:SLBB domain-containing protein [Geomonas agri]